MASQFSLLSGDLRILKSHLNLFEDLRSQFTRILNSAALDLDLEPSGTSPHSAACADHAAASEGLKDAQRAYTHLAAQFDLKNRHLEDLLRNTSEALLSRLEAPASPRAKAPGNGPRRTLPDSDDVQSARASISTTARVALPLKSSATSVTHTASSSRPTNNAKDSRKIHAVVVDSDDSIKEISPLSWVAVSAASADTRRPRRETAIAAKERLRASLNKERKDIRADEREVAKIPRCDKKRESEGQEQDGPNKRNTRR